MKNSDCLTIILAAGEGKRMNSSLPKVLHPVAGLAMIGHVLKTVKQAGSDKSVVVVGAGAEQVTAEIATLDAGASFAVQHERLGTAHAVLSAQEWLQKELSDVLVLYGDVPLIKAEALVKMRQKLAGGADIVVLGFEADDPAGYGRLLVEDGQLTAIREHKDATDEEKSVTLCNSGVMAFRGSIAYSILNRIDNNNSQSEFYLPDAVEIGRRDGLKVVAMKVDEDDVRGVNDRVQLAEVEEIWQQRKRRELMLGGVSMASPNTVILAHDTKFGRDCSVEPNVVFANGVAIADNVTIRSFSYLEDAIVGNGCVVGPYARLRPGTVLEPGAKVGNFCEIKKAIIGEGSKVNHFAYIGDANIGKNSNIGAGTITCNYDGTNKHQTNIGDNVFIGSNSSLVAPVSIGNNAIVAAGSVVIKDVPADALGIARGKQINKDGLARKIRNRNAAAKKARLTSDAGSK